MSYNLDAHRIGLKNLKTEARPRPMEKRHTSVHHQSLKERKYSVPSWPGTERLETLRLQRKPQCRFPWAQSREWWSRDTNSFRPLPSLPPCFPSGSRDPSWICIAVPPHLHQNINTPEPGTTPQCMHEQRKGWLGTRSSKSQPLDQRTWHMGSLVAWSPSIGTFEGSSFHLQMVWTLEV